MAIKIQLRRGTAAEWTSANPTLSAGEAGFETDTGKIKFGDGTTAWTSLGYATSLPADIATDISDAVTAHNGETLNVHGIANTAVLETVSGAQGKVDSAVGAHNLDTTDVHGIANTAALETITGAQAKADAAESAANGYTDSEISALVASSPILLDTLNELAAALNDDPNFATTVANSIATKATLEIDAAADWTSANTVVAASTFALESDTGRFKIGNGVTAWTALAYAAATPAQLADHDSRTTDVHGIANAADLITTSQLSSQLADKANLNSPTFTGTVVLPESTSIANVSAEEISYLNGVTSLIQGQIDDKLSIDAAVGGYAPIANASLTGTVILPETTSIGSVSSTEISYVLGVTSSIQTQLNAKASSTDLSTHTSATTSVHGIANTAALETTTGAQSKADAAESAANGYTNSQIAALTTADIEELTNLYFTDERAQDAVGANVGNGLTYDDVSAAISVDTGTGLQIDGLGALEIDSTVATLSGAQALTNKTIDTANNSITVVAADISDVTASAAELNTLDGITASTAELNILEGVTATATELNHVDGVTSAIQTQLDGKAPLAGATFTGSVEVPSLTITGNLVVQGTTTTVNAADLKLRDNMIYLNQAGLSTVTNAVGNGTTVTYTTSTAHGYEAGDYVTVAGIDPTSLNISGDGLEITAVTSNTFTVTSTVTDTYVSGGSARGKVHFNPDLGWAAGRYDTVNGVGYGHAGMFRDASDGVFKLFDGYTPEPDESIFIDTGHASFSLAPVAAESITVTSATIGDVSNTEIQYLNGVTSAIQTQVDAKAPLASPTFTGAPTAPTATADQTDTQIATTAFVIGQAATVPPLANGNVTGSIARGFSKKYAREDHIHPIDTTLAPKASPTFTGAVTVASEGIVFTDGTQTKAGVPSITTISQKTASYTLSNLNERDTLIEISSSSATTLTIPAEATVNYPVGTTLDILQTSTGQVTIAGAGGVTVNATPGLKLRTQWSSATLLKRAADTWVVYGDLMA